DARPIWHAGQLADAVDRGHGEAVPAVAPCPAGTVLRIEVHDAHAAATLQMVRGGEPGLAGSDHNDVRAAHLGLHARHNAGTREMFPPGEGSHAAVVTSLPERAAARPASRSAQRSSRSSSPTLRRTVPGRTPQASRCASVRWEWVVVAGWQTSERASPMFTAIVHSRSASQNAAAA